MIDMLEYFAAGSPEPAAAPFKTPHALRAHSATYPPAHGSTTAAAATAKKPTAEQIDAAAKTLGDAARAAGLGTFTDATTAPKMPAGADADGAWAGDDDAVFVARPLALQLLGAARGGGALELEARGGFWSRDHSLEGLRARVHAFARARDWLQFHTPRNLCLALVGEVCARAPLVRVGLCSEDAQPPSEHVAPLPRPPPQHPAATRARAQRSASCARRSSSSRRAPRRAASRGSSATRACTSARSSPTARST